MPLSKVLQVHDAPFDNQPPHLLGRNKRYEMQTWNRMDAGFRYAELTFCTRDDKSVTLSRDSFRLDFGSLDADGG